MIGIVPLLIFGLVAVLGLCVVLVAITTLTHSGSTELTVTVLGFAGIIVAALVGLLNAQLVNLHMTVNSRMDQLISNAFVKGQAHTETTSDAPSGDHAQPGPGQSPPS